MTQVCHQIRCLRAPEVDSEAFGEITEVVPWDILALDWGALDASALRLAARGVDLVLGADVLYDKSPDFDRLFATVRLLLERSDNPCAVFLTAYQHRAAHRSIQALLRAWGLRARIVQQESSDDADAGAETETEPRHPRPVIDIVEIVLESPARD